MCKCNDASETTEILGHEDSDQTDKYDKNSSITVVFFSRHSYNGIWWWKGSVTSTLVEVEIQINRTEQST